MHALLGLPTRDVKRSSIEYDERSPSLKAKQKDLKGVRYLIIWKMMDAWHLEWHVSHGMALPECFCNRDAMVRPGFTAKLKNFLLTKGIRFDDWKLTLPRRFHSIISQRAPRAASTKDERLAGGLRASPRPGDRLRLDGESSCPSSPTRRRARAGLRTPRAPQQFRVDAREP